MRKIRRMLDKTTKYIEKTNWKRWEDPDISKLIKRANNINSVEELSSKDRKRYYYAYNDLLICIV